MFRASVLVVAVKGGYRRETKVNINYGDASRDVSYEIQVIGSLAEFAKSQSKTANGVLALVWQDAVASLTKLANSKKGN